MLFLGGFDSGSTRHRCTTDHCRRVPEGVEKQGGDVLLDCRSGNLHRTGACARLFADDAAVVDRLSVRSSDVHHSPTPGAAQQTGEQPRRLPPAPARFPPGRESATDGGTFVGRENRGKSDRVPRLVQNGRHPVSVAVHPADNGSGDGVSRDHLRERRSLPLRGPPGWEPLRAIGPPDDRHKRVTSENAGDCLTDEGGLGGVLLQHLSRSVRICHHTETERRITAYPTARRHSPPFRGLCTVGHTRALCPRYLGGDSEPEAKSGFVSA